MAKDKNIVISTVFENDVDKIIIALKKKNKLKERKRCPFCKHKIEGIGAFIPMGEKITTVCDRLECMLKSSYKVMKFNGNGSLKLKV